MGMASDATIAIADAQGAVLVLKVKPFWVVLCAILITTIILAYWLIPDFAAVRPYALAPVSDAQQVSASKGNVKPSSFNVKMGPMTRTDFVLERQGTSTEPVAIYVPAYGGEIRLIVNGNELQRGAVTLPVRLNRYRSTSMATIPASLVRQGQNRLTIEQYNNPTGLTVLPVFAGPVKLLSGASDGYLQAARFMKQPIAIAIIIAIGMAMFLVFFAQNPERYLCLLGMFLLLLIIKNDTEWAIFDEPVIRFINYVGCVYELMAFLAFSFWTNGSKIERRFALGVCIMIACLIFAADLYFGLDSQKTVTFRIAIFVLPGIAIVAFVAKRVGHIFPTLNPELQVVFAIITALVLGFVSNLIGMYYPMDVQFIYLSSIITQILTAFCLVALSGFALSFELDRYRAALRSNEAMQSIVAGHGLELGQQSQRLKSEIERRAVLEERQRFTRDMHDGIGGQLLSLLLKARSGDVELVEVERDVSQSLNDLRLVAAALDGADDGFGVSLNSFRERARDQLAAAKIGLDWQEDENVASIIYDPRETLDVLRILQEGITNIIRHAQASHVIILFQVDSMNSRLLITFSDDGLGLSTDVSSTTGTGIKNIAARAARLGGSVTMSNGSQFSGTVLHVSLDCPCKRVS